MKQIQLGDQRDPETYAVIGAAMEVHRILGPRSLEPVYHAALELELDRRQIPFAREVELPVFYKGVPLRVKYRADLVCYGSILVELKSVDRLTTKEEGQILNYLAASRIRRGLLLNFGTRSLQYQRFLAPPRDPSASSA